MENNDIRKVESVPGIRISIDNNASKSQQSNFERFSHMLNDQKQKKDKETLDNKIIKLISMIYNKITFLEYSIDLNNQNLVHKLNDIHLKFNKIKAKANSEEKLIILQDINIVLDEIKNNLDKGFDRKA